MSVSDLLNMQGNLANPPYTLVLWSVYGQPDNTGSQSGFFGQLDPNSIKVNSIVYNNSTQNPLTLTVGGDLSGSLPNPNVVRLQGKAISATAPVTGNLLLWNGTVWSPSNLGNGLSLNGTSWSVGQNSDNNIVVNSNNIQLNNTIAFTSNFTLTDSAGISLNGPINLFNAQFQFAKAVPAATISQADNTTNSATAQSLIIQAQNATGTSATGGALVLKAGSGTGSQGNIVLFCGNTETMVMTPTQIITLNNITWSSTFTPALGSYANLMQQSQSSDIPTNSFIIQSQAPFSSATGSNKNPGNIIISLPAPISGGSHAVIKFEDAVPGVFAQFFVDNSSNANIQLLNNAVINGTAGLQLSSPLLGFYSTAPVAQPSVTGALSSVTDANAKAVLTSILAALSTATGVGLLVKSTT